MHEDEAKTPRQSGTLGLAEVRAVLARDLATQLREEHEACNRGARKECIRPLIRALNVQRMANDCVDFARQFASWKTDDPGSDLRNVISTAWVEHERACKELLADKTRWR